jgi:uncharacterized protein YjiS (DUF1127 family)
MMNFTKGARLNGQSQTQREQTVWLPRIRAGLSQIPALWAARRKRAREFQSLSDFSDRELWDIGISRSDVSGVINGTYRRD